MARPGKKRTPKKLQVLKGAQPCRINKNEPEPVACIPSKTAGFRASDEVWNTLCNILGPGGMNILTSADGIGLELLCESLEDYRAARNALFDVDKKYSPTYEVVTALGLQMIRPRPEVAMASDAWRRVASMLGEFGVTPAARTRVSRILGDADKNKFAKLN